VSTASPSTECLFDGVEYGVDCLVFATGCSKWGRPIRGPRPVRDVRPQTGVVPSPKPLGEGDEDLPRLPEPRLFQTVLHMGMTQTGFAANFTYLLDEQATHVAHLVSQC